MNASHREKPISSASRTPRYISEGEASAIIGISGSTLRKWRMRGKGPLFRKLGDHSVRYPLEDLLQWLELQPAGGDTRTAQAQEAIA